MSQWKIEYTANREKSPLSYWVHAGVDEEKGGYIRCTEFTPPFPNKIPLKGYPHLTVTVMGFEFNFTSNLEVDHCIDILGQKNLPTTISLSTERGTGYGPNNHWLSRLPSKLKPWSKREKIILALNKAKLGVKKAKIDF